MFAALIAVTLAVPAAPAEDKEKELPEAAKKELTKFEGKWKAVKFVANEAEEAAPDGADTVLEFKGRKILLGDKELFHIPALDPGTDPKCLDMKALADQAPVAKDTVYEAIYKFDGDELTIAVHVGGGAKRPDKFESPKDSGVVVVTLKRMKD
jgi:uncharacterized protein (TIGR03067 family)